MIETIPSLDERMRWWREAKFGMIIHWGLYSLLGRHEWVMNRERIPLAEYEALANRFTAEKFDPRAWARLAREAGQKYVVLTTKHHEGFCLFDSQLTDYTAPHSPARRDVVAEFVEAVRAEGLRVGLYYSLMDWHHPDGARCFHDAAARTRFIAYIHGQVRELMTRYGRIDILWYDVPWPLKPNGWDSTGLNHMVRSLQPEILINNRSGMDSRGSMILEDFDTPENSVHASPPYRDWESCDTINRSWGWNKADQDWKSVPKLLGNLVACAGCGGNLLLNIGPRGDGSVEEEAVSRLREMGAWLRRNNNGESIFGAERAECEWMNFAPGGTAATAKGNTMYWHVSQWYGTELWIGGIQTKVKQARIVSTGAEIKFQQTFEPTTRLHLYDLPATPPDPWMTVIALECDAAPRQRLGAGCVWVDGIP
ncbi:MAG: alpha-L-fucosidase [Verrucomicrobiota bacterium]